MADNNRLELDIVAVDQTEPAVAKARTNFQSIEQQAAKSAATMTRSFDAQAVEMARSVEKASAGISRSLQALEQRAALAGKSGMEKLLAQKQILIDRAGSDEAQIQRIVGAMDRLMSAQQRLDRASATRSAGTRAGQAILQGEAEFEAGLQRMQRNTAAIAKLQQDRAIALESPTQRIDRERAAFLGQFGGSSQQRAAIEQEFALRRGTAAQQEVRAAGIAAGKAVLPGEAEFQAALRRVQERDAAIRELEDRAAKASLPRADYYRRERDMLLGRAGVTEEAAKRIKTSYEKIIEAAGKEEGHGGGNTRRLLLAGKDALEGYTRGTMIEIADYFVGTSGGGGVLQGALPKIAEVTGLSQTAVVAIGALAGAFVGLEFAGVHAMKALGEESKEIENLSLRTGIDPTRVQAFQFAAKIGGANPDIFEKMTRGLAQASEDESPAGAKARREMEKLGVSLRDQYGDLKPTEQILLDLADGFNKLPPGLQRSAASMEIFKRIGIEALPVLKDLRESIAKSDEIGKTFTGPELAMAEGFHKNLVAMGEEWARFKNSVEVPLAIIANVTLKGANEVLGLFAKPYEAGEFIRNVVSPETQAPQLPEENPLTHTRLGPPTGEQGLKLQQRMETDAKIRELRRSQGLQGELEEAKRRLQGYQPPKEGATSAEDVAGYEQAYRQVQSLERIQKDRAAGAQDIIMARKEQDQLKAQLAQVAADSQLKDIRSRLDQTKELASTEDIGTVLRLTRERVARETEQQINARRYRVDEKSAAVVDLRGTAGFQQFSAEEHKLESTRLQVETAKVLAEFQDMDNRYFKNRAEADFKAWDEAQKRKLSAKQSLEQEIDRLESSMRDQYYSSESSRIDRQKDMALQSLGIIDAQSLKEKRALEDQKFAIETFYAEKSLALQIQKLNSERNLKLGSIDREAGAAGLSPNDEVVLQAKRDANQLYDNEINAARQATSEKEIIDAQKTANEKAKLQIESNKRVYESLKQDAAGLFDQLVYHTKSWGDFAKDILKATVLTPVKEIFSSQVAALFTKGITGQDVTFGEVGSGQGTFGKLGSIFGRAGLGQARFGSKEPGLSKLEQPNHIGDVSLLSGAVPVVITNAGQLTQANISIQKSTSIGSIATGFGLGSGLLGRLGSSSAVAAPARAAREIANYRLMGLADGTYGAGKFGTPVAGGSLDFGDLGGNSILGGIDQFPFQQSITGGPGGTSGFTGPVGSVGGTGDGFTGPILPGINGPVVFGSGGTSTNSSSGSTGGGGILSGLFGSGKGGLFGGLKNMFGLDTAGTDMGGGVGIARQGLGGNLAAISKSSGFALLGGIAALDGIHRGGVLGTLEAAGGGAMVGFKYGGPIGAAIGAAIGGGIAAFKSIFGDDRGHVKKLVKQVYGMDINNPTADAIIQIAKQKYGGQHDLAIRSPEVRELLRLYAQTMGDKAAQEKFVADKVHSASLIESGGRLYQGAVYDNGSAYSYSSPLSVYGGMQTSPLPTYAPNQGVNIGSLSLSVNGQSASNLLAGQVATVATPGFIQSRSLAASQSSIGRSQQTNLTLSPSALAR